MTIAAGWFIAVFVVAAAVANAYNIDEPGDWARSESDMDTPPVHGGHAEHTCAYFGLKICPTRKSHFGYHYNEHLKCLIPKAHLLPRECRMAVIDLEHCIGDIDHYCDGLGTRDTKVCLEHHLKDLHPECVSSMFFRELHHEAGRPTTQYQQLYNEYQRADDRFHDVRIADSDL